MRSEPDLLTLPNEILLQVFRRLPRRDLFFGVAHVNHRFRTLVQSNLKSLKLFDAHCHVNIVDHMPLTNYRNDGTDPIISYEFSLYNRKSPEYTQKRRLCLRGNDTRYRELHLSHGHDSKMHAQFDRAGVEHNVSAETVKTILSYMNVQAMRFQVRKQCRAESSRIEDDFFADAIQFCERMCCRVDLKSLLLCSKSILFPWQLAQKSLLKLSKLHNLQNLILENMTTFDPFSKSLKLPVKNLCSLQFRLDPRHRADIVEEVALQQINGSLLKLLGSAAVYRLDFSAYTEVSRILNSIDAVDMCEFIETWHFASKPWHIKGISFNSAVTIDEFRIAAYKYLPSNFAVPIPYCQFQTVHKKSRSVVLILTCYANGNSTQWSFRTGYLDN